MIDCNATSAARVGRIGAICAQQDKREAYEVMDKLASGDAARRYIGVPFRVHALFSLVFPL